MWFFKKKGIEQQLEEIAQRVQKQQSDPSWYAKCNYRGEKIEIKSDKNIREEDLNDLFNIIIQQYYIAHLEPSIVGKNICYNYFKGGKCVLLNETTDGVEAIVLSKIIRI